MLNQVPTFLVAKLRWQDHHEAPRMKEDDIIKYAGILTAKLNFS
jgi:hypothetical protein